MPREFASRRRRGPTRCQSRGAGRAVRRCRSRIFSSARTERKALPHRAGRAPPVAMRRRSSGATGAGGGCQVRSSREAVVAPPSSSHASNAGRSSKRPPHAEDGSPKVARHTISCQRSMRRDGPQDAENADPRTFMPPDHPRARDGDAAPGQTNSVPRGMTPKRRSSTNMLRRAGIGFEVSGAARCAEFVPSVAMCLYVGISRMATSSAPVQPVGGGTLTWNVDGEGWRCTACRWTTIGV
jgi:hypothetical protein